MINTENINTIGELMEPSPIGFNFGAPGWTLLLIILLLALMAYGIWKIYQYRKNKYRRIALKELNAIQIGQTKASEVIINIITLLKRVALTAYGREQVAEKNGEAFLNFLQQQSKEQTLTDTNKAMFTTYLYEGDKVDVSSDQLELLRFESINWIKQHHV